MMIFPVAEYQTRLNAAQRRMDAVGLGALLLTTEAEIRYFSGYLTRFWESPSRPWFLILPASGDPIAVIPSIGAPLMRRSWISDIRTWPAPVPADDGVTLLADTLREIGGPVGLPSGPESSLRMPLADFRRVQELFGAPFATDHGIVAGLRAIKSAAEIDKIATSCAIAGRAFARVPEIARPGVPLSRVFRDFQRLLLDEGADWVPYLAGGAGPDGYADVISPADDTPLAAGDVLMLDTGAVHQGYFCDYDRNFAIGPVAQSLHDAHARLLDATDAGLTAARPGARACDVWAAMNAITHTGPEGGRLGHGLGMQLTEGLSLTPLDHTILLPGMVLTLEPGIATHNGNMLVHEENIVITSTAPRLLTTIPTTLSVL